MQGIGLNTKDESSWEIVHAYSRAMAIEDGVLVDVTEAAARFGFKVPVAMTQTVYLDCVDWTAEDTKNKQRTLSREIRLDAILERMKRVAVTMKRWGAQLDRITFVISRVPVMTPGVVAENVRLVAMMHPGDSGEPVITISFPDED